LCHYFDVSLHSPQRLKGQKSVITPFLSITSRLKPSLDGELPCEIWSKKFPGPHRSCICRAGYYQLRQLRPVVRSMTAKAARTVAAAVISSRLDYCNALLHGQLNTLLRKLQSVQNATARLITGTRRCDHITPVLRELHWLPIRERVQFKLACPGSLVAVRAVACLPGR